jgi:hypothetical protein
MKSITISLISLFAFLSISAQPNYSGAYGYSFKPQGEPPASKTNDGPKGNLVLLKMEGNKYRFWLDVSQGWPYYHVGETDGTISFVNDTASFDNTYEDAANPCILSFRISDNVIHINSHSTSFNCGFGQGVNADGDYTKLKLQPILNNEWLRKEYSQSPEMVVTSKRAEIFQDENCLYPFSPKRYFLKDETFMSIAETEKTVYTEYIPFPGKFVWGWMKKTELKTMPLK